MTDFYLFFNQLNICSTDHLKLFSINLSYFWTISNFEQFKSSKTKNFIQHSRYKTKKSYSFQVFLFYVKEYLCFSYFITSRR